MRVSTIGIVILVLAASFGESVLGAQAQPTPSPGSARARKTDPKCVFLRAEYARLQKAFAAERTQPILSVTNAEELALAEATNDRFVDAIGRVAGNDARQSLAWSNVLTCERGEPLSSLDRLSKVEQMRQTALKNAKRRFDQVVTPTDEALARRLAGAINNVFDAEVKSFYHHETGKPEMDPEVVKDFPMLPVLIDQSGLSTESKVFFKSNLRAIRYEEAGRLVSIFNGNDPDGSIGQALLIRKALGERVIAAQARTADEPGAMERLSRNMEFSMTTWITIGAGLLAAFGVYLYGSLSRAKYRAFKTSKLRVPIWAGLAELVLWEPGETVVLLRHKRMTPMTDPAGGYMIVSALRGEEFKGRISYKTQLLTYRSDPILTSDGLSIHLDVGIWWRIASPSIYLSKIASDYHSGDGHENHGLIAAAVHWIQTLAGGTLREQVNKLPAEKLISPYVQQYIQVAEGKSDVLLPQFSDLLQQIQSDLSKKTDLYGIEVERLEVRELKLPTKYHQKLENVRVAFLDPYESKATSEAKKIALQSLADVIGRDKVGLIEILKHVDLSGAGAAFMPGIAAVSFVQPVTDALKLQAQTALPPPSDHKALPPAETTAG